MVNNWQKALKIWNARAGIWCMPKKDSSQYKEVKKIQESLSKKKLIVKIKRSKTTPLKIINIREFSIDELKKKADKWDEEIKIIEKIKDIQKRESKLNNLLKRIAKIECTVRRDTPINHICRRYRDQIEIITNLLKKIDKNYHWKDNNFPSRESDTPIEFLKTSISSNQEIERGIKMKIRKNIHRELKKDNEKIKKYKGRSGRSAETNLVDLYNKYGTDKDKILTIAKHPNFNHSIDISNNTRNNILEIQDKIIILLIKINDKYKRMSGWNRIRRLKSQL